MRLSPAQRSLLETISYHERGRPFRTVHFTYAPMRRLIAKQAVERVASGINDGWVRFRITDVGRTALERSEGSPVYNKPVDSGNSGENV